MNLSVYLINVLQTTVVRANVDVVTDLLDRHLRTARVNQRQQP